MQHFDYMAIMLDSPTLPVLQVRDAVVELDLQHQHGLYFKLPVNASTKVQCFFAKFSKYYFEADTEENKKNLLHDLAHPANFKATDFIVKILNVNS